MIETKGLTKRYGETVAVDELDLQVRRGEVFGLLGPNGAGKTTTILMLLGLTEPTSGTARVDGMIPTRDPLAVKSRVGYLPDDVGFYDDMTARQNLRYTAAAQPPAASRWPPSRVDDLLHEVGLGDDGDRKVGGFSRGMRQRLGLADALVKDPSILILDEPTVNIDPEGVRELLLLVERLRADQGVTVLLSSHLLHQVEQVCDRIGVFVKGKLVGVGHDRRAGRRAGRPLGVHGRRDRARRRRRHARRRARRASTPTDARVAGTSPPTATSATSCSASCSDGAAA